ncbi:MAG TPA: tetratricopeptide repeat protein [Methanoregulaceae archaeon]|nr:tetratricopeptide repeat protein [Methanoregulaceae archaeon]
MPEKDLGLLDRIGKELHLQVGTYLLSCNDPIGALREFDAALGIDPADGAVVLQKARALSAIGRWDQAIEVLRTAIASAPGNRELHQALGAVLEACGRYDEAREAYAGTAPPGRAETVGPTQVTSCFEDVGPIDPLPGALTGERVIVREVVRIPCQYCGSLVDITRTTCQSCGAPLR